MPSAAAALQSSMENRFIGKRETRSSFLYGHGMSTLIGQIKTKPFSSRCMTRRFSKRLGCIEKRGRKIRLRRFSRFNAQNEMDYSLSVEATSCAMSANPKLGGLFSQRSVPPGLHPGFRSSRHLVADLYFGRFPMLKSSLSICNSLDGVHRGPLRAKQVIQWILENGPGPPKVPPSLPVSYGGSSLLKVDFDMD